MAEQALPQGIMRMLNDGEKRSNQDVIVDYLISEPGTVILTAFQEELLRRWTMADDLLRSHRYKIAEVARILRHRWNYGVAASLRDIQDARFVFGSTRKTNKKYLLTVHIDRIEDYILELRARGEDDLAIKLIGEITKAIKEMPEEQKDTPPPAALVFNFTQNNVAVLAGGISEAEAEQAAKELGAWKEKE